MDKVAVGENIRLYRLRGGYTQKQFAEALGISAATLSSYEAGKTLPDMTVMCKIADMFRVSTDELAGILSPDSEEDSANSLAESFKMKN